MPTAEQLKQQAFELMRRAAAMEQGKVESSPTISELWDLYSEEKRSSLTRWSTVECLMRPILKRFGTRAATSLRTSELGDYLTWRLGQKNERGRTPSPCTVNHEVTRLAALCTWAADEKLIASTPFRRKPRLPVPKRHRPEWGEAELDRLLDVTEETWFKALIQLRWQTGMRPGEARMLRWEWIDWRERCIMLPAEATKTRTERTIGLTPEALEALHSLPRRGPHVFTQHDGHPWCAVAVWKRWRATVERSGLEREGERVTFHDLRAIWCRLAKRRGIDINDRMANVGHESTEVHKLYQDGTAEDARRTAATFSAGARRERKGPQRAHHRRRMTRRHIA